MKPVNVLLVWEPKVSETQVKTTEEYPRLAMETPKRRLAVDYVTTGAESLDMFVRHKSN